MAAESGLKRGRMRTLPYAWHAFPETPAMPASPVADLVGNVVFALGAVLLITLAWRRTAIASTIVISS
jgi:hypothetical protein